MVPEIAGLPVDDDRARASGIAAHQNARRFGVSGPGHEQRPEIAFPVTDRDDPRAGAVMAAPLDPAPDLCRRRIGPGGHTVTEVGVDVEDAKHPAGRGQRQYDMGRHAMAARSAPAEPGQAPG